MSYETEKRPKLKPQFAFLSDFKDQGKHRKGKLKKEK